MEINTTEQPCEPILIDWESRFEAAYGVKPILVNGNGERNDLDYAMEKIVEESFPGKFAFIQRDSPDAELLGNAPVLEKIFPELVEAKNQIKLVSKDVPYALETKAKKTKEVKAKPKVAKTEEPEILSQPNQPRLERVIEQPEVVPINSAPEIVSSPSVVPSEGNYSVFGGGNNSGSAMFAQQSKIYSGSSDRGLYMLIHNGMHIPVGGVSGMPSRAYYAQPLWARDAFSAHVARLNIRGPGGQEYYQ